MKRPIPKTRKIFAWVSFALTILLMLALCYASLQPGSESAAVSGQVGDKIDDLLTEQRKDEIKHVEPESLTFVNGKKTISALEMNCGQSRKLSYKLSPSDTSVEYFSLEWTSDAPDVVSVKGGTATAVSVGTATVTASVASKKSVSASLRITVKEIAAKSLSLVFSDGTASARLEAGRHISLSATLLPADATEKTVRYFSEDPSVAAVDERGVVTAVSVGKTKLVAEHALSDGKLTASAEIEVVPESSPYVALGKIELGETSILYAGENGFLPVRFTPENATEKALVYRSSDSSVLRVDAATGSFEALKRGDVTVTAVSALDGTISATADVRVRNRSLEAALAFTGAENSSDEGYLLELSAGKRNVRLSVDAKISPVYVKYESSDESVAEVFEDGTIATYRSSQDVEGGAVVLRVFVADNPEFSSENGDRCTVLEVRLSVSKQAFSDGIVRWGMKIRKSIGHFGAFFALGLLGSCTAMLFDDGSRKRRILFAILLLAGGVLFAGFTEFLQSDLFTVGRAPTWEDVLINCTGYLPAVVLAYGVFLCVRAIVARRKNKKRASNS